jgi:hypothetical protein
MSICARSRTNRIDHACLRHTNHRMLKLQLPCMRSGNSKGEQPHRAITASRMNIMRLVPNSMVAAGFMLLALPVAIPNASAQPGLIIGSNEAVATVETVDQQQRTVLLRDSGGSLVTLQVGPEVRNLRQVQPGDQVTIRHVETIAAQIAQPGEPLPESTTSVIRAASGERPRGILVNRSRMRVTIDGIDTARNSVAFVGPDGVSRTATVRLPAMRDLLRQLKVGDQVDVAFTDVIAISVNPSAAARP